MTTAQEPIRAYHLLNSDGRLGYQDNREVRVGETLEVEVEPELCERGLHASRRCLDTLQYSPGENPRLCLVEVSGDVRVGTDKICGRRRKVMAMLTSEATAKVMQEFACRAAEMALELVEQKGGGAAAVEAGRKAVEMARRYRRGDCTEAELVAARDAVWAAWDAAGAAGYAAGATWAAGHAAWAAGHAAWAAGDAAEAAGYAAGAGVSRDQLAAVLEGMVTEAFAQAASRGV